MSKLTLSGDPEGVARAKRYAKGHWTSGSGMVVTYLSLVSATPKRSPRNEDPPVLRSLLGILKEGDIEDYHKHLLEKYR